MPSATRFASADAASKSGTVGFIGGMDIPLIHKFECGFAQGFKAAKPDGTVLINYTGTTPAAWNDPVKGGELAKAQISQGADVIYAAAGGRESPEPFVMVEFELGPEESP